jgi:murein DD-endopeptidase MepM/ murein hydrolase activator NlpD
VSTLDVRRFAPLLAAAVASLAWLAPLRTARADAFTHDPSGQLASGSGSGRHDDHLYAPTIRFPIESGPAFANSQVWGHGGSSGPPNTSQCDPENFRYPWHDNYCETRDWSMPLCPSGTGHQGQDVRSTDCNKDVHTTVAVIDGTITSIGSYSVYLTADDGVRFDYLHMSTLLVKEGDRVKRGQPIGKVSNHFGTSTTTVHLHFNIFENVAGVGAVYVPPYASLIQAYEELLGLVPDAGTDGAPPTDTPLGTSPAAPNAPPAASPDAPAGDPAPSGGGCAMAPARAASAPAPVLEVALLLAIALALGLALATRRT